MRGTYRTFAGIFVVLLALGAVILAARAQGVPASGSGEDYGVNASGKISDRGLVAHWHGDSDPSDRRDKSPGTISGGVTYAPGMVGKGFYFDGGADTGVSVPDTEPLKLSKSFTISAWVFTESYPTPNQRAGMIVFRGDDRSDFDPYYIEVNFQKQVRVCLDNGVGEAVNIAAPLRAGRFVLITATLDDTTGQLRLYENGHIVAATTTNVRPLHNLDPNANPGFGIGNHGGRPNSPHHYPFHGIIDDVRMYDRALSSYEVLSLYDDRMATASL